MSSPRSAATKTHRRKGAERSSPRSKLVKAEPKSVESTISSEAKRLAAEIDRGLASGEAGTLSAEALQALMSAVCRTYAMRIEAGEQFLPLSQRSTVSPTEVMVTASGLLRAANLAVFELGMWQSWTGR